MGELTNNGSMDPGTIAANMRTDVQVNDPGKIATDVEGIFADGQKNNLPVFDIDHGDFYANMKADRQRVRFKNDSAAGQYLRNTHYKRPFYLRTTSPDGQQLLRKVK
jgi:hypothetical protein